jgi:hypothetical protein
VGHGVHASKQNWVLDTKKLGELGLDPGSVRVFDPYDY